MRSPPIIAAGAAEQPEATVGCNQRRGPVGSDITVIHEMRFVFDRSKSREVQRKHGLSLEEAQEIFEQAYLVDQRSDAPEQFRAIGWSRGRLCSVIFEIRRDAEGEYYHLVTAWRATKEEEQSYAKNV